MSERVLSNQDSTYGSNSQLGRRKASFDREMLYSRLTMHAWFSLGWFLSIPHLSELQHKFKDVDVTIVGATNEQDEDVSVKISCSENDICLTMEISTTLDHGQHNQTTILILFSSFVLSENPRVCQREVYGIHSCH